MAKKLVKCKACGAEIAKSAKTCPHCGAKSKKGHPILFGVIIIAVIFVIVSLSKEREQPKWEDYLENNKPPIQGQSSSGSSSKETTSPAKETIPSEETKSNQDGEVIDGMRTEFKEALDSYEDFFEEYCRFMKKYAENPTDMNLLTDYSKYMSQYVETMEKLEALEDGEMNMAESKYYIEVSGRIAKMLSEVSFSIG